MCETHDSQPPVEPRGEGVSAQGDFHLVGSDGNRPMAYFARAVEPRSIGVVIVPARLGLLPFYKTLTVRFAEIGIDAVALDLYGRTAGDIPRNDDLPFETHYEAMTQESSRGQVDSDVRAAVDFLKSDEGGAVEQVFTVGICFGGSVSWWQSAIDPRLSGCVGLYGAPRYLLDLVPQMTAPLLLLHAGDDAFIPPEEVNGFERDLTNAGIPFEAKVYPGAPHSFFDRRFAEHREAAADAWSRILAFIDARAQDAHGSGS